MFQVCEDRCDQCLFSTDKIVSDKRRRDVLRTCAQRDRHFVCHKFTIANGGSQVCCRAFFDRDPEATNLMRIAMRLGCVEFVPLPTEAKKD